MPNQTRPPATPRDTAALPIVSVNRGRRFHSFQPEYKR